MRVVARAKPRSPRHYLIVWAIALQHLHHEQEPEAQRRCIFAKTNARGLFFEIAQFRTSVVVRGEGIVTIDKPMV